MKRYPGSVKGPDPEDDPEAFAEWYVRNLPKELMPDGQEDVRRHGGRFQFKRPKQNEKEEDLRMELSQIDEFYLADEITPGAKLPAPAEFLLLDHDSYQVGDNDPIPDVVLSSYTGTRQLDPLPASFSLVYDEIHHVVEKWGVFKCLPDFYRYARGVSFYINLVKSQSVLGGYDYQEHMPGMLWAYYSLLPDYARNNPIVRNSYIALEHHQPRMTLEQKQVALNLACSLVMPIGPDM